MKLLSLLALLSLPCLAAEDDGDWDFLKSRLPKEENEFTTIRSPEMTNTFRFVPAALRFIEGAEKVTVFEGLPHHTWEPDLLKQELDRAEETTIGDFPFYPQAQDLDEEDQHVLRWLTTDANGISPFLYHFMCGGFHPDYVIRFTKGDENCDLLICFGCAGARILHDGKVIHAHMKNEKVWRELLAGYDKNRPKSDR